MKVKVHNIFDVPVPKCKANNKPSLVQRQFKDDADINNIIARYAKTGYLTDPLVPATRKPFFGDFTNVKDYHEAQNIVIEANKQFASLPAHVRERFKNDPALMLRFLDDTSNYQEAVNLGLVDPSPSPLLCKGESDHFADVSKMGEGSTKPSGVST